MTHINDFQFTRTEPTDSDDYTNMRLAFEDADPAFPETPYGATKTAELDIQFAIDPAFGLTKERYGWYSNGVLFDRSLFTEQKGKIQIETTATSDDSARLRSAYPGRYVAHTFSEPGVGGRIPEEHIERDSNNLTSLTHGRISLNVAQWSTNNGRALNSHGIAFESDGVYHRVRSDDNTEAFVPQEDWNIDPMDGTGPSGIVLKPEDGYVYLFQYTWYGEGAMILSLTDPATGEVIPMNRYVPDKDSPSTTAGNMPCQVVVENQGTADPLAFRMGGMQYTTHGSRNIRPNRSERTRRITRRTTGSYINTEGVLSRNSYDPLSESGDPLVAVRRDPSTQVDQKSLSLDVTEGFINADQDLLLYFWDEWNPDSALTNESFNIPTNATDNETRIEVDTEATDYTPSADSVIRSLVYVDGDQKRTSEITGNVSTQIPLQATLIVSVVKAVGRNNTDAQPLSLTVREGF